MEQLSIVEMARKTAEGMNFLIIKLAERVDELEKENTRQAEEKALMNLYSVATCGKCYSSTGYCQLLNSYYFWRGISPAFILVFFLVFCTTGSCFGSLRSSLARSLQSLKYPSCR